MTASGDDRGDCALEVARDAWAAVHDAIDVLRNLDMTEIAGPGAEEFLRESRRARACLESVDLRALRRFENQQSWRTDGYLSAASCVRTRLKINDAEVRERLHSARLLDDMPQMAQALAVGDITYAHLRTVSRAADQNPSRRASLAQADNILARSACTLNPKDLNRVVQRWTHAVDPQAAVGREERLYRQRAAWASTTFDGAVDVRGLLAPEGGVVVVTALDARVAASYREAVARNGADERDPAQRRADALVDLAAYYLDNADLPHVGGSKPHVQVIVPLATLQATRDQLGVERATLVGVGAISGEAARRMSCDASIVRIVLDPTGLPLDVGRTTRTIPTAIRTALDTRDGGCRFPGCERKKTFSDGHHIKHWGHGGPTSLENLVLLCRHHHRLVHESRYRIDGNPNTVLTFTTPDGRLLEDPLPTPRGTLPLEYDG